MGFVETIKQVANKAWYDTVMPLATAEQRQRAKFSDYFLSSDGGLSAILPALTNAIRRPPAFLLNFISELFGHASQKVWSSDSILNQGLSWTAWALQKLFKGGFLLFQLLISPLESYYFTNKAILDLKLSDRTERMLKSLNFTLHTVVFLAVIVAFTLTPGLSPFLVFVPIVVWSATTSNDIIDINRLEIEGAEDADKPVEESTPILPASETPNPVLGEDCGAAAYDGVFAPLPSPVQTQTGDVDEPSPHSPD